MPKKMSAWNAHVKSTFHKHKKGNPAYKFSQALKDAAATWKAKKG